MQYTMLEKKLNLNKHKKVFISAPALKVADFSEIKNLKREKCSSSDFPLIFYSDKKEKLEKIFLATVKMYKDVKDPIIWILYPKVTCKKYKCEFNRNIFLKNYHGYAGIKIISMNEDISAVRLRKLSNIKRYDGSTLV